jgi:hypothetical protein
LRLAVRVSLITAAIRDASPAEAVLTGAAFVRFAAAGRVVGVELAFGASPEVRAGVAFRQAKIHGVARSNFPIDIAVFHRRDNGRTLLAEPDWIAELVFELYTDGIDPAARRRGR